MDGKLDGRSVKGTFAAVVVAGAALLSSCGPKQLPPPPPPPVATVPPYPYPPMGASVTLAIPPVGPTGTRMTVNNGIGPDQTVWTLRSAYNVAALNCLRPEHAEILTGYRAFLKNNAKALSNANRAVDNEFRRKHGARFVAPREAYMTQVYNYFALPPTLPSFCDAALVVSQEAATVKSADLDGFAVRGLSQIELVFLQFYQSYDQYRDDLTAWQQKYMAPGTTTVPVAITLPAVPAQRQGEASAH